MLNAILFEPTQTSSKQQAIMARRCSMWGVLEKKKKARSRERFNLQVKKFANLYWRSRHIFDTVWSLQL
jgi:hypothetical protein